MSTTYEKGAMTDEDIESLSPQLRERFREIKEKYRQYLHRTHEELGAASTEQTEELRRWVEKMTVSEQSVKDMELTWYSHYEKMLQAAEKLYNEELKQQLEHAYTHTPKLLSRESKERWLQRFKNRNVHYKQKEEFIRQQLPLRIEMWKKAAEARRDLLQNPAIKHLSKKTIPHLAHFLDEEKFLALHCVKERKGMPSRVGLVAMVRAALDAARTGQNAPYERAKSMLEEAANSKIISWSSVGVLLRKIFSGHDLQQVADFVDGNAAFTLRRYLEKRTTIRNRYLKIEEKTKKDEGIPRNFWFVSQNVFLNWSYEKQKTYVTEAEYSFETLSHEPDIFHHIKHELAAGDSWEAERLIGEAKAQARYMTKEQRRRLLSMEKYFLAHVGITKKPIDKEHPTPEEIGEKMSEALGKIGYASIQDRFERALKLDYRTFWALCTMNYNWKWCRLRGYSNDKIDRALREGAKDETYIHLKHGQPKKGKANNDMTTDTSVAQAARWHNNINAAQAIHVNETTDNGVLVEDYIRKNKNNRSVWYWSRIMEKNIPYGHMKYVIENIQPVLKWGMQKLDEKGYRYNRGKVEPRYKAHVEEQKKPIDNAAESQLFLAA